MKKNFLKVNSYKCLIMLAVLLISNNIALIQAVQKTNQAVQKTKKTLTLNPIVKKKNIKPVVKKKSKKKFTSTVFTLGGAKITGAQLAVLFNKKIAAKAPKSLLNSTVNIPNVGKFTIAQLIKISNAPVAKVLTTKSKINSLKIKELVLQAAADYALLAKKAAQAAADQAKAVAAQAAQDQSTAAQVALAQAAQEAADVAAQAAADQAKASADAQAALIALQNAVAAQQNADNTNSAAAIAAAAKAAADAQAATDALAAAAAKATADAQAAVDAQELAAEKAKDANDQAALTASQAALAAANAALAQAQQTNNSSSSAASAPVAPAAPSAAVQQLQADIDAASIVIATNPNDSVKKCQVIAQVMADCKGIDKTQLSASQRVACDNFTKLNGVCAIPVSSSSCDSNCQAKDFLTSKLGIGIETALGTLAIIGIGLGIRSLINRSSSLSDVNNNASTDPVISKEIDVLPTATDVASTGVVPDAPPMAPAGGKPTAFKQASQGKTDGTSVNKLEQIRQQIIQNKADRADLARELISKSRDAVNAKEKALENLNEAKLSGDKAEITAAQKEYNASLTEVANAEKAQIDNHLTANEIKVAEDALQTMVPLEPVTSVVTIEPVIDTSVTSGLLDTGLVSGTGTPIDTTGFGTGGYTVVDAPVGSDIPTAPPMTETPVESGIPLAAEA